MDINWQIAMTAIKIKKFYKKTGRRPRVDGKMHVAFDKRKVECFNCHNTGHFAKECKFKGSKKVTDRKQIKGNQNFKPVQTEKEALMTIDEGQINWVEQTEDEELNHALMAQLEQEDIDDSLYVYGKYGPQPQCPSPTESATSSTAHSTCQSNDSDGELGAVTDQIPTPSIEQVTIATPKTQPQVSQPKQTVVPSCAQHVKPPRQPIRTPQTPSPINTNSRQNWNQQMERELGAGYSFQRKTCFVCGSLSHLIKDCDYYEKKMAREDAFKSKKVVHANVRPIWTNTNRVNKANQFTPRPVQL
ncbi:ribonuclease H-like domain-containing protein, partial [Tanacetum coccineum]